jgi:hypothetical protein
MKNEITYENVEYGILVEVAGLTGDRNNPRSFEHSHGYHSGMKVHFFNKKGVFIGNAYEWVRYSDIRFTPSRNHWERHFMGSRFEKISMLMHKLSCKIITKLIRFTQRS